MCELVQVFLTHGMVKNVKLFVTSEIQEGKKSQTDKRAPIWPNLPPQIL